MLRDEALVEIAHHTPKNVKELARTRGLGQRLAEGSAGEQLLQAVQAGLDLPDDEYPQVPHRPNLPRGIGPVTDLLKVLLKMKCEQQEVAQKLIANGDDIEKIAAYGEQADVPALAGWRRQLFGEDALNLRNSKLALVINGQALELVEIEDN